MPSTIDWVCTGQKRDIEFRWKNFCIRKAMKEDVAKAHELYIKTSSISNEPVGARYSFDDFMNYVDDKKAIFLICKNDNSKIVGLLLGFDLSCWCYIDVLIVSPDEENKGIGSKLIDYLVGTSNSWDRIEMCYYTDEPFIDKFFEKNGFEFNKIMTRWVSRDL